ncbi:MAG TPA: hypothetical protein VL523_15220 [Terriglobia bacterium]|nr:hypothetical protein [Terriglobia bacterium]
MGLAVMLGATLGSLLAAGVPDTGTTPVQVTVSISGQRPAGPSLTTQDLMVFQDGARRPVVDLKQVSGGSQGGDLAILVDGSLGSELGLQFGDLEAFVRSLPPSTWVGVAYAEYGAAKFSQDFTADHGAVDKALRLPEGQINAGASIYQSVQNLLAHWPADGRMRSVLLVSNGIDIYRGLFDTQAAVNPDLQAAIDQAHKSGATIFAIYAGGAARLSHRAGLVFNGQDSLERLTSETGGEAYFQGLSSPVAFSPFLNDLRERLGRQYVLTFAAATSEKPGLARLRVTTEVPLVKISAPNRVWVPAAQ